MPITLESFEWLDDARGQARFHFTPRSGKAGGLLRLRGVTSAQDFLDATRLLIGGDPDLGEEGKPLAHPMFPWLVCLEATFVGVGKATRVEIDRSKQKNQNTPGYWLIYDEYHITCVFGTPEPAAEQGVVEAIHGAADRIVDAIPKPPTFVGAGVQK